MPPFRTGSLTGVKKTTKEMIHLLCEGFFSYSPPVIIQQSKIFFLCAELLNDCNVNKYIKKDLSKF